MKPAPDTQGRTKVRSFGGKRTGIITTAFAVVCTSSIFAIPSASAAVPTFPDNLVVFPDRDFITIEGYQDRVGQTATIEVSREGAGVVGSASSVVGAGDVAFEINHPGGVCWGAGTGLNVTPDIKAGDVVSIKFDGAVVADTRVQDANVTGSPVISGDGTIMTIKGHIAEVVNEAQFEQRVIEPALKETDVGRRDVRALPGPVTSDDSGAYTSGVVFEGNTFTATYDFTSPETAQVAAAGGARAMAWEQADVDGNRQGLTIAEFGEVGGPGMGGCPNGPLQSGPPAPTDLAAAPVGTNGDLKVTWTPAQAIPGTPAITGYRVTAVANTITANEQIEIGKRISGQGATGTTITGLNPDETYEVYVVAVSSVGETFPAARIIPASDAEAPTVSATPGDGATSPTAQEVTLTSNEPAADIYYTTDGSDPITSGGVGAGTLYTGPIAIGATTTITYAAIDPSGNVSNNMTATYTITNDPLPAAPTFTGAPVAGKGTASLAWTAPDAGAAGLSITSYTVQAYTADGTAFGAPKTVAGDVTTLVYDGLTGDTVYQFTVRASNTNGTGPASAKSEPVTVQGALVAQAGADQTVVRRTTATPVTLDGTGSTTAGATYLWEQVLTGDTDPDKMTLTGATTLKPTFTLPVYKYPATNNPLTFRLTVTAGGESRTDEVKVTPVPDRVAIGRAEWKSGDFRVSGTSSAVGSVITLHKGSLGGPVLGRATVTAAVAPATGGEFSLRLRDAAAGTSNPGTVWIESSVGGVAGPTTVTNR
ncbi:hypothetical protein IWX65_001863 [Arthrobacter sp. CAN_A214]|uniref:fibronectin type III domain-containing protein n=1 Tax=Arthrobacter sp. CAN_A214 TaxID=2787720 RepID=UPI0018CA442F